MSKNQLKPTKYNPSAKPVENSKEKALSEREFELLIEGTYSMKDYFDTEARLVIFLAGRLGMRVGEIIHMKESWVDWRNEMIRIPLQQDCDKGKDGSTCGYCMQNAEQMAEIRRKWKDNGELLDDHLRKIDGEITAEDIEPYMWSAKTESASRESRKYRTEYGNTSLTQSNCRNLLGRKGVRYYFSKVDDGLG